MEAGVGYSTEAGTALQGIVRSANELHTMVQQIASAAEAMARKQSEEISRDIESIATVASQASSSSAQTARSSGGLAGLAKHLQEVVGEFTG